MNETATIRRTLAEHRLVTPVQCRCGWRETDGHGEQWHEHAAAAVALVRSRVAEALDAALPSSVTYEELDAATTAIAGLSPTTRQETWRP